MEHATITGRSPGERIDALVRRQVEYLGITILIHRPIDRNGDQVARHWQATEKETGLSLIHGNARTMADAVESACQNIDHVGIARVLALIEGKRIRT
jgi:hypothetical protein